MTTDELGEFSLKSLYYLLNDYDEQQKAKKRVLIEHVDTNPLLEAYEQVSRVLEDYRPEKDLSISERS